MKAAPLLLVSCLLLPSCGYAGLVWLGRESADEAEDAPSPAGALFLSVGQGDRGDASESNTASGLVMAQLALTGGAEAVTVRSITMTADGTGSETTDLFDANAVRFYEDLDGDGVLDAEESKEPGGSRLAGPLRFDQDDGTVTAGGLVFQVPALGTRWVLVVYDMNPLGTAALDDTFRLRIASKDHLVGTGGRSGRRVTTILGPGGPVVFGLRTISTTGSVTLTRAPAAPGARIVVSGPGSAYPAAKVPGFPLLITAASAEDVTVTSIRFRAAGTGDDLADVVALDLYLDADEDGELKTGGTDVLLKGPLAWSADDGEVLFDGLSGLGIAAGKSRQVLLAFELSSAAPSGKTWQALIESRDDINGTGDASGKAIGVGNPQSGASLVRGPLVTVAEPPEPWMVPGPGSPADAVKAIDVNPAAILQFAIFAPTSGAVSAGPISFQPQGTADGGQFSLSLYGEQDGDPATLAPGPDPLLDGPVALNNGVWTFASPVTVNAGLEARFWVSVTLSGQAPAKDKTLRVILADPEQVTTTLGGQPATMTGPPLRSATFTAP